MKRYEREFAKWESEEKEATMELISSWAQCGIDKDLEQGRQEGKEELLSLQLEQRFSTLPTNITKELDQLSQYCPTSPSPQRNRRASGQR